MPRRPSQAASRHRTSPDPLALAVGVRVRKLRDEQDFSFDAFVEETGLGRGYISELERGLVVPSLHSLSRLATALEVTVADLVLGPSPRERLFDATRGLPETDVQRLLDEAETRRATLSPAQPPVLTRPSPRRKAAPSTAHYSLITQESTAVIREPPKRGPGG